MVSLNGCNTSTHSFCRFCTTSSVGVSCSLLWLVATISSNVKFLLNFIIFYRNFFSTDSTDYSDFHHVNLKNNFYNWNNFFFCLQIFSSTEIIMNSHEFIRNSFFADDTNEIGQRRAIPQAESYV